MYLEESFDTTSVLISTKIGGGGIVRCGSVKSPIEGRVKLNVLEIRNEREKQTNRLISNQTIIKIRQSDDNTNQPNK